MTAARTSKRSPEIEAIIEAIPSNFAADSADYNSVRKTMAPFHGHPLHADTHTELRQYGGVDVGVVSTLNRVGGGPLAFFCHGGAFVSCTLDQYEFYGEIISQQTGLPVLIPDYRLAPEQPYPAAHDDCFNAYRGLLADGIDPNSICMIGDSCGGSLALGALIRARDEDLPMPACFVSLTGWFDLSVAGPGFSERDPFVSPNWIRNRAEEYLAGSLELNDPRVSPAYADLRDLPPLYLQVGQFDTVREGALALAANGLRAGVEIELETWPGMVHGWHGMVSAGVPEAIDAWASIRRYLSRYLPG